MEEPFLAMRGEEGNPESARAHGERVRTTIAHDGSATITCGGHSMSPAIALGEKVRVVEARRLQKGDVALFFAGDALVLHRITLRIPLGDDALLVHAGDATRWRGGLTREKRVLGRVPEAAREVSLSRSIETLAGTARSRVGARFRSLTRPSPRPERVPPSPESVGEAYDLGAAGFDARFSADPRTAKRFRVIDRAQRRIARTGRVLEIGCGSGRLLSTVEAPIKIGVDVSRGLLAEAKKRGIEAVFADAHALPFGDHSFDAVLAGNGVFRHLDYPRAFAECARVLVNGGRLAVHQYAYDPITLRGLLGIERRTLCPLDVVDLEEIRRPAREAGFEEEKLELWRSVPMYPYVVPIPEPIAGRLWNHVSFIFRKA
jgi:SAM-dependent methyltransferase